MPSLTIADLIRAIAFSVIVIPFAVGVWVVAGLSVVVLISFVTTCSSRSGAL
jgi:hypothetical protein